jgi:hypothetical protein
MASGIPWVKVFSVDLDTRSEAVKLENKIKKRGCHKCLL